jgi:purine-binding chemotaxis protein CheW
MPENTYKEDSPEGRDPDIAETQQSQNQEELLSFMIMRLGQSLYSMDSSYVSYLTEVIQPSRIPTAPSRFLGVVHNRGQLVTIIDLASMISALSEVEQDSNKSLLNKRLLVINLDDMPVGIIVDAILGLREILPSTISYSDEGRLDTAQSSMAHLLGGHFDQAEGVVTIIRPDQLILELLREQ